MISLLAVVLLVVSSAPPAHSQPPTPLSPIPSYVAKHLDDLRNAATSRSDDSHMDVWKKSALECQMEGFELCANVTVAVLDFLVGKDPPKSNSFYSELTRSKAAWQAYYNTLFNVCPKLLPVGKPADEKARYDYDLCHADAARNIILSGTGNNLLRINTAIAFEWVAFFELPSCMLAVLPGTCGGQPCDKVLNWHMEDCYHTPTTATHHLDVPTALTETMSAGNNINAAPNAANGAKASNAANVKP